MDQIISCHAFDDAAGESSPDTQQLANEGHAHAQFWLGFKLACEGTSRSFLQAGEWYRKAAEQGHALAQFNLGVMYFRGQGVEQDRKTARLWMTKAAERGDCGAQYMLGMNQNRLSFDEQPVTATESRIEAYKWLQLAAAQGYGDSSAGCDQVTMGMTVESVREGKRRAEAFVSVGAAAVSGI